MRPKQKQYIELLRSTPESEHTQGRLCRDGKFCALGLLSKLDDRLTYLKDMDTIGHFPSPSSLLPVNHFTDNFSTRIYIEWDLFPWIVTDVQRLNDNQGKTFAEIADYLEAVWS